jgi:hypothetical protein
MKMEFKEFDGSNFVASSELAPDLQAVLQYLDALSNRNEDGSDAGSNLSVGTLPGLARILEDTKEKHEAPYPDKEPGTADKFSRPSMLHRCLNCKCAEEATCIMVQRRNQIAMSWKLIKKGVAGALEEGLDQLKTAPMLEDMAKAGDPLWGPGTLWVPTALQIYQTSGDMRKDEGEDAEAEANKEELGPEWGAPGAHWVWAHNGTKPNGWFRLCRKGRLVSKWGSGIWYILRASDEAMPLLIITFSGVEHGLRLLPGDEPKFDTVSVRRLKEGQQSLKEDANSLRRVSAVDSPVVCMTVGWPGKA